MKIFHGGVQLTDLEDYPAYDVSVNGQLVFEAVDIVRAATKRFFSRGNKSGALQFGATRKFGTMKDAQKFILLHFSLLPEVAMTEIVCGVTGEDPESVYMPNAILSSSPQGIYEGILVRVQYAIQFGVVTTEFPPDILIGGEDAIMRGKQAIASGAETVAVVFGVSFPVGTDVVVTGNVSKPNGGSNIVATIREDLTTVNGFTAELSGPTPDANHKLHWTAYGI